MKKIVISLNNGLLAEAITSILDDSGEFLTCCASSNKENDLALDCKRFCADIVLAEVSYACDATPEKRFKEIRAIRYASPNCKIALLCDDNSAPEIAHKITTAKKDGVIDVFFYSSVTAKYLTAVLSSL